MKYLRLFLLLSFFNNAFGQESAIHFLFNPKTITYIDNSVNTNYTVSFRGDTAIQSDEIKNVYSIDSATIQINKYPIPDKMQNFKYDSITESKLLMHFRDYEFDYMQEEIFYQKMECHNDFFSNHYAKRFLLWYFKMPDDLEPTNEITIEDDSVMVKEYVVDYQVYLAFTTNSCVTMINIPVYTTENLSDKIEMVKSEISNTVRIYGGDINIDALNTQIDYRLKTIPFIIYDSVYGIQCLIPFWLNVISDDSHVMVGTFPDIDNVSNALMLAIYPKGNFNSFKSFEDRMLLKKEVKKLKKINYSNENITRYKVVYKAQAGFYFTCQYVFLNLGNHYGILNFTATDKTYDKNINRLEEFVNNIKIN